jgi:hypothetical protein
MTIPILLTAIAVALLVSLVARSEREGDGWPVAVIRSLPLEGKRSW